MPHHLSPSLSSFSCDHVIMSPKEYIQARCPLLNDGNHFDQDQDQHAILRRTMKRVIVDGCPYLPFLEADPTNEASIKLVVSKIILNLDQHQHDDTDEKNTGSSNSYYLTVLPVMGGNTNMLFRVHIHHDGRTSEAATAATTRSEASGMTTSNPSSDRQNDDNALPSSSTTTTMTTLPFSHHLPDLPESVLVRIFGGLGLIDRDCRNIHVRCIGCTEDGIAVLWPFCQWPIGGVVWQ